jgi:SAM-dependent methyltransferase
MTEALPIHLQELILDDPGRGDRLIGEFYEKHHEHRSYEKSYHQKKIPAIFKKELEERGYNSTHSGLDLGLRGGALTEAIGTVNWMGVDIDTLALARARERGIPCMVMDISKAISFKDNSFDVVMLTEVLEHLPYPWITFAEVHRVVKKGTGLFLGTVPLDYHLHRRYKVLRGKRLSGDPTHIHHFSLEELRDYLRQYFEEVKFFPLRGTAVSHPGWKLPMEHFVSEIGWAAAKPRASVVEKVTKARD